MNLKDLNFEQKQQYYKTLCEMISPSRTELFEKVIEQRTDHLSIVLENIYQPQNASAVLRTAECLGVQQIFVIENNNDYVLNPDVALGANNWLDLHRFNRNENNTADCLSKLKADGYTLVATLPTEKDVSLPEIPIDKPLAIMFGTEKEGLSPLAKSMADICMKIPMYGFTESYNISVSAAITMYSLTERLRASEINYRLNEQRRLDTLIKWAKHSIRHSDKVEKEILKRLFE
ncbi:MAG: RNA methyltransferase [Bacteroidales bacterium]|nr:RNA methyltransferase [Bacteroidales bacterium]